MAYEIITTDGRVYYELESPEELLELLNLIKKGAETRGG